MARVDFARARALAGIVRREAGEILSPKTSDRPWELPFAIAVAGGLPMFAAAWAGRMEHGALASIGAMTILYLPRTSLDRRVVAVMAASCAMIACYALGQVSQVVPALRLPVITGLALLVTMACRYYRVAPPGPVFFVMAGAIGAYAPGELAGLPFNLGIFALGSIGAVGIGFLYSVHILRFHNPLPSQPPPDDIVGDVVADSAIIALFVGLSLGLAEAFGFEKPYWVPVSCLAVMQGQNLRAVFNRKIQRILGTVAGLGLTWVLVRHAASPWHVAAVVTVLLFLVEAIIVRHYALAAVFITPLTIVLAEAAISGPVDATPLLVARLLDTIIGAAVGLIGGVFMHRPRSRQVVLRVLTWLDRRK